MEDQKALFSDMNDRMREVFRHIVENYLETGDPMGSRSLTRELSEKVSAATIRNVMQDLEHLGLLDSPHTSAGRRPTEYGLRMFVDGVLEVNDLGAEDRAAIKASITDPEGDVGTLMDEIGTVLSGVTKGASLVLAPKRQSPIKHIEFLNLAPERALVVLVFEDGQVENRVFNPPPGQTPSSMREAANFLNSHIQGRTISELQTVLESDILAKRQEIDVLSQQLVESGLAVWSGGDAAEDRLIVRGRSNLIGTDVLDIERMRTLFDDLELKSDIARFLELSEQGTGVRIFIGSENKLFSLSGSSLVISSYMSADRKVLGTIGVIGPTRLNYGRVIPVVNYTAELLSRILSER